MEVKSLFSTPFLHMATDNIELCKKLETYILNAMKDEHRIKSAPQQAHPDLFESSFDFLNWGHQLTNELKNLMLSYLLNFIKTTSNIPNEKLSQIRFVHESWFHVARNGGYFQSHTHPNHSWSMVFCVNPGDENNKNEYSSGKLLFIDPRLNASMYMDPANNNMKREFSYNGLKVMPIRGSIIIFPSFLQHSVEPYIGSEYRITVAANFKFFYNE